MIKARTRLVACNHASNIFGTVNDVRRIVAAGKAAGAVTVVDAVQSAPHLPIDVASIGCDLLACSTYKFFGPHAGVMYVEPGLRDRLSPLKVHPASWDMPWRLAPGTPSFETQAGTHAAIEHIAWLGESFGGASGEVSLRQRIVAGLEAATAYEVTLMDQFLAGTAEIPSLVLYGIAGRNKLDARVPTFSFRLPNRSPQEIVQALGERNIFWLGRGLLCLRSLGASWPARQRRCGAARLFALHQRGRGRPRRRGHSASKCLFDNQPI
jgi:selenocysteine lyase/cysteine desulfurase